MNRWSVAAGAATLVMVAACGTSGTAGDRADAGAPSSVADDSSVAVPEGTSAFQAGLLEGGVTFAEYEQAVLANISCLESVGYEVTEPLLTGGGRLYSYLYTPPGFDADVDPRQLSDETIEATGQPVDDCYLEYLSQVDIVWTDSSLPSTAELDAEYDGFVACLDASGMDTAVDDRAVLEGIAYEEGLLDCLRLLSTFFEYPER